MSNVKYIEKVLVTDGNLGFVPAATPLYTSIKKSAYRTQTVYNVVPKQLVAWVDKKDGTIPLTVTPATLTAADLPFLHIGVGYDGDGDGIVEAIRQFGPDNAEACAITKFNAAAPQCGMPEIKALYPGCLDCEPLTVRVRVSDSATRSFGSWKTTDFAEFVGSYTPDCATCGDCDKTVDCDEYICGLVDDLNADVEYKIYGEYYPDYMGDTIKRPFKAVKLHSNWYSFCFAPSGTTCKDCYQIDALESFTIGEGEDAETIDFISVTNPADNTQTLITQLEFAAKQIENAIQEKFGRHAGWTVLSKGIGECCGVQLHVVTCDDGFILTDSEGPVAVCENAIDPEGQFTVTGTCKQCGSTETPDVRTCGIAIIADQDKLDCDCFLEFAPAFTGRTIEIDVTQGKDISKYSKRKTLQEGRLPSGFGAEVQFDEYRQLAGYSGYDYSNGNNPTGNLGLPDKTARIRKAVTADCKKSYCLYEFEGRFQREFGVNNGPINRPINTRVWVPQNDLVTQAAVEDLAVAIATLNPGTCRVLTPVGCDGQPLD